MPLRVHASIAPPPPPPPDASADSRPPGAGRRDAVGSPARARSHRRYAQAVADARFCCPRCFEQGCCANRDAAADTSAEEAQFWRLVGVEDEVQVSSNEGSPSSSPALLESYREYARARKLAADQSYITPPTSPPLSPAAPKSLARL